MPVCLTILKQDESGQKHICSRERNDFLQNICCLPIARLLASCYKRTMSIDLIIPPLGESISEATLVKWLKQPGDSVAADEPVAELETDKITVSLPAPKAGTLQTQKHPAGTTVRIGESIGTLTIESGTSAPAKSSEVAPQAAPPAKAPEKPAPQEKPPEKTAAANTPSAAAKRAQSETKEQASALPGPALPPSKRQALRDGNEVAPSKPAPIASSAQKNMQAEEIAPMSPLRKRIAERLVEAQHTAAILTTFNEVDMSNIMALRSKHQEAFTKKHGIKLGFMSFFVKACASALKAYPGLNAELRGTDIVYKKFYHFGIAVGSGRGLVVPVIRGVDQLSLAEIEKAIVEVAQKAKDNKLTLDDLSGGTFSITNGGIYGSMMSTPLLNMPQTGILGMHNIVQRPVAKDNQVVIRPMMYLALSYDHRVVDGREAVQFLVHVKDHLEQPEILLLDL